MKDFLTNKLFLKLAYMGAGLLAGHLVAFLATSHVQTLLGQIVKDPTPLPGASATIDKWIITGITFLSVFASHYFHESVVIPQVNKTVSAT